MFTALVLCCICLACGDSPTKPSPSPPPVVADITLSVSVVGHISNQPLAGVTVRIAPTAGGGTNDALTKTTSAAGLVSWRVVSAQRYSIYVRDRLAITESLAMGDVGWLVSLPE
jgi:hypothetical protein